MTVTVSLAIGCQAWILAMAVLFAASGALGGETHFTGVWRNVSGAVGPDGRGWRLSEGKEFPGARGSLSSRDGVLVLDGNFDGGGNYVGAGKTFSDVVGTIACEVRTPAKRIYFRLTANDRQTHQHGVELSGDAEAWQEIEVAVGKSRHHWGGGGDGAWRHPLRSAMLTLPVKELPGREGRLEIRNVRYNLLPEASFTQPDIRRNFFAPGPGNRVAFRLAPGETGLTERDLLVYRLVDFAGAVVCEGFADPDPAERELSLPVPETTGYYELVFPHLGLRSGLVVDEPFTGPEDPYFGLDCYFTSWGGYGQTDDMMRAHMRLIRENGIRWTRDRLWFARMSPEPGVLNFSGRDEKYRRLAREAGFLNVEGFHSTPEWTRFPQTPRTRNRDFPGTNPFAVDLIRMGELFVAAAERWADYSRVMESWNEPDHGLFGHSLPPEYYSSTLRALSVSLALAGSSARVAGGSFANPVRGNYNEYYRLCLRNGLAHASDIITFHTYSSPLEAERMVAVMREAEKEIAPDRAGIPYWITECGKYWSTSNDAERCSFAEMTGGASDIAAKAAEFRALGAETFMLYTYKNHAEFRAAAGNGKNTGSVDYYYRPMAQVAGYFHAVRELSHKQYIGDLAGLSGTLRSRVFSDGADAVAVVFRGRTPEEGTKIQTGTLYQPYPVDPLRLPPGLAIREIRGTDGRRLSASDGIVAAQDALVYLRIADADVRERLRRDTRAMELARLAAAYAPSPRDTRPVVLQAVHEVPIPYAQEGYYAFAGKPLRLSVALNNFSDRPVDFKPLFHAPENVQVSGFAPDAIRLAPQERRLFDFDVLLTETGAPHGNLYVTLTDEKGNAGDIAFSLLPVSERKTLTLPMDHFGDWVPMETWTPMDNGPTFADMAAKFRLRGSETELTVEVDVKDAVHACPHALPLAWLGDSVQFAVQSRGESDQVPEEYAEYLVALRDRPELMATRRRPGIDRTRARVSIDKTEGGMLYRIRVPAAEFGAEKLAPGAVLGFSVLVNGSGGDRRDGYLSWGGGIGTQKYPQLYHAVEIR